MALNQVSLASAATTSGDSWKPACSVLPEHKSLSQVPVAGGEQVAFPPGALTLHGINPDVPGFSF